MMRLPAAVLFLIASVALADDAANKKLLKDLEGSYAPVSMTKGGERAPDDIAKTARFQIKGDTFIFRFGAGKSEEEKTATIILDTDQKPTAMDMTPKEGPEAGKPMLGIVKVEKDSVTLCFTDEDKPVRPKDFTSTKENKNYLIVMKKVK
jgi:uncharacterized protein (TIGR03067 family)